MGKNTTKGSSESNPHKQEKLSLVKMGPSCPPFFFGRQHNNLLIYEHKICFENVYLVSRVYSSEIFLIKKTPLNALAIKKIVKVDAR